ncbi:non-specific lipid-transfer protein 2 [Elaeis guineensis]|uniref:Non-specific lipid-transfer protein 2 n=1 Tax=Elaeis guineensis var. tenera TaxID=51953 RepID=A0A1D5AIV1_ELAGV|nr:non-specific lipid-transfer protein 2 [Elaeis guineensis]AOC88977.1 type 2 nonspecific lipid transfer protein LTP204 [Elaeis guineensis]
MKASFLFLCVVLFGLLSQAPTAMAVTCNPSELSPCAGAILGSSPPTSACCAKLKAQQPCFCQYAKNPSLKGYINSPNSRKVLAACGVSTPSC